MTPTKLTKKKMYDSPNKNTESKLGFYFFFADGAVFLKFLFCCSRKSDLTVSRFKRDFSLMAEAPPVAFPSFKKFPKAITTASKRFSLAESITCSKEKEEHVYICAERAAKAKRECPSVC